MESHLGDIHFPGALLPADTELTQAGSVQEQQDWGLQFQVYGHWAYKLSTAHQPQLPCTGIQKPTHILTFGK